MACRVPSHTSVFTDDGDDDEDEIFEMPEAHIQGDFRRGPMVMETWEENLASLPAIGEPIGIHTSTRST